MGEFVAMTYIVLRCLTSLLIPCKMQVTKLKGGKTMHLPKAKESEVYAARQMIDFGNGFETVIVIYPKNKLIPKYLADEAIRKLKELESQH